MSFPNPVNETSARVVAGGVVAMAVTTVVADQPLLLVPLTYGFAARVAAGPTWSPLGQLATRVVTPRLDVRHRFSPGPPKRMAQAMGLMASASAGLLVLAGRRRAAYGVLSALTVAAGLEAGFGRVPGVPGVRRADAPGCHPGERVRDLPGHLEPLPAGSPGPAGGVVGRAGGTIGRGRGVGGGPDRERTGAARLRRTGRLRRSARLRGAARPLTGRAKQLG